MFRFFTVCVVLTCTTLVCVLTTPASSQPGSATDRWGLGLTTDYSLPLFKFADRYEGAPRIAGKFTYEKNGLIYNIGYFYSNFSDGKIEKSDFQWSFDGEYYSSPNASSEMNFTGLVASLQKPLHFTVGPFVPFWTVGSGFIHYKQEIRDLVFPGQSREPLDYNFTYSPEPESRTILCLNFGGGLQYSISPKINLNLSAKYDIIFGSLHPMEAWLLEKVSPLQLFNVGLDITYYLSN